MNSDDAELASRVHGDAGRPTLVYLPGLHGDWTLAGGFRASLKDRVRLVEFCYPRSCSGTLADHARAISRRLTEMGIDRCWLLAESFGSQVAWAILEQGGAAPRIEGMILAGGFVIHPWKAAVRFATATLEAMPAWSHRALVRAYPGFVRMCLGGWKEIQGDLERFVEERLTPGDREAMAHRLRLILAADFRPVASVTQIPLHLLTGFWDPVVPWPPVKRRLKQNCPGFRGCRILWNSDHPLLVTRPSRAAEIVLEIIGTARPNPE